MRNKMQPKFCVFLIAFALMTAGSSWAQIFRGGISGTVTDGSGAAVASAPITAQNVNTGVNHLSVSSSAGTFTFADLPLGTYSVTVEAPGFEKVKVDKVPVSAGQIYDLPIKLGVVHQETIVEVSADALNLDTATTANTATLSTKT